MHQSLISFLGLACGMGALSLLTPCVFPMIPITVSYFTGHRAKSHGSAVINACVYALGVILTFAALGMALALVFGASGVNRFAANPWVNLLIAAIFLGFSFSLFGAFIIQAPSGVIQRLDGIARHNATSRLLGTLLMGLVFTLTSFTCTAPFVGTLLVIASQGSWKWPVIGMLAFSTTFAMPFFLFALLPQLLTQLPKSGGWLNSVKVVMGFMEIAAAMKFLSNADLIWHWGVFTRDVVLTVWVATGIMAFLYLLGKFQTTDDTVVPALSVPRTLLALFFLSGAVWLGRGLLGRPMGEIDAFLPPSSSGVANARTKSDDGGRSPELTWIVNDYSTAIARAKEENKPLFIDFTGYTCTNCRWMEANMFPRTEVARELEKFVRVRLYTDGEGEPYQQFQKMQQDQFGTVALPYYGVASPGGTTRKAFEGLTRDPDMFVAFLKTAESMN